MISDMYKEVEYTATGTNTTYFYKGPLPEPNTIGQGGGEKYEAFDWDKRNRRMYFKASSAILERKSPCLYQRLVTWLTQCFSHKT